LGEPAHLRGERTAAAALLRSGPVAGFAVLAVCLLAAVLVPFGLWRPEIVWPLLVLSGVAVWRLGLLVPYRDGPAVPVWSAALCILIAVGFALWAGFTHGEHVVIRRDAGSYALYTQWIATRYGLPVDAGLGAFGGAAALAVPGFSLASPAFFEVIHGGVAQVVPQFLIGAPAVYSLGWWVAGWNGMFWMPAVIGGLAVLSAAGLAARLVGPRWAALAAASLALTQPVLHASRSTYSEPPSLLLVLVAGSLAADALQTGHPGRPRRLALAAGLVLGLAGLVRVDAVRDVALVIPVCAVLTLRRHLSAAPLAAGALAGTVISAVPAVWLSRPYLDMVWGSLRPLLLGTVALTVLSVLVMAVDRGRRRRVTTAGTVAPPAAEPPAGRRPALEWLAAAAVLGVGVLLASRPWWMVAHQADNTSSDLVASLQAQQQLRIDGARSYAEDTVRWVVWYVGPVTALAALAAAAVLAAAAARWWRSGPASLAPAWLAPAVVGVGSTVLILYRPGITPDHPWADRRLVPTVLPAVALLATATAAWSVRYARRRLPVGLLAAAAVIAVPALLVPSALATAPLAGSRTEVGQPEAVAQVCAALAPGDVVLAVHDAQQGDRAQNEWVQVIRGVCDRPAAALRGDQPQRATSVRRLGALVQHSGHRLVLLSAAENDADGAGSLTALGLTARRATLLHTHEDPLLLVTRPSQLRGLTLDVWLAVWSPGPSG
jgi:hypothetical protein